MVTGMSIGKRMEQRPRFSLGVFPTPLDHLENLSSHLDIDVWMKRDDLTDFGLGGNKVRKLEFLIGHALEFGFDMVITTGGSQSNHARLTAAACRKAGLDCYLVLDRGRHPDNGNLLLDRMLGAKIELLDDPDPQLAANRMAELAETQKAEGRKPYVIPRGGSVPTGAVGYLNMVLELDEQLTALGVGPQIVYVPTGSCGTHSGMLAGRMAQGDSWTLQGISVSHPQAKQQAKIAGLAAQTLELIDLSDHIVETDVRVDDMYVGEGYGFPTPAMWEGLELLARLEGIIADPVYTGKALAGLIDHARRGIIARGETVIFVHTGGAPALFAYGEESPWSATPN